MKKLVFLFILLSLSSNIFCAAITIRIQFPFFFTNPRCSTQVFPDLVGLSHNFNSGWPENILTRSGDSYYYSTNVNSNSDFLFSIRYQLGALFTNDKWVNSKWGPNCARVYVNNTILDASYMTTNGMGGSNFAVRFDNNGNLIHCVSYPPLPVILGVPPEVAFVKDTIEYRWSADSLTVPYGRVQSWMVAVHDNSFPDSTSKVEVDYVKLFSKNRDGTESQLYYQDYSWNLDTVNQGGLYMRYPWFVNDLHIPIPASNISSVLTMMPYTRPFVVWHWWDTARSVINTAYHKHYKVEVRMRITGKACVQIGYDYWRSIDTIGMNDTLNHREVACSNWYFTSNGWQTITFDPWTLTAIELVSTGVPEDFSLSQNYPNPFNPKTIIEFTLPKRSELVELTVYDINGKVVEKLVEQQLNAGTYKVSFDAGWFASGIYFYTLKSGEYNKTKKMVLLK